MFGIFNPQGPVASSERDVIVTTVLIMLVIVVPALVTLYTFAWKYRAGNKNAKYEPDRPHNVRSEIILWLMPAAIIAVLAFITWNAAHALDPSQPIPSGSSISAKPLEVQVIALQWKWLFIYPTQGIATVNYLEIPAGTPVHFDLTADGPISSFWIPQLGSQIYAMAAMQTQLNLLASTTGEFVGKDTEINGDGYAGMTFAVHSVSQSDFDTWVASVKQASTTLDEAAYTALAAPSEYVPPAFYSSVAGDLFNNVMMMYMMPMGSSSTMSSSSMAEPSSSATSSQMMPGMHM
jgi:cytochrome o ubiquinol oxidase subunit 2